MGDALHRSINIDAGILSTVVLMGGYRVAEGSDGDDPRIVKLTGLVRDFHERTQPGGHPDFEQRPDHGFGHYSGNVGLFLGADGKPVFTGQGRKISSQYRDSSNRPIAPHLVNRRFSDEGSGPDLTVDESLNDQDGTDSYSDTGAIQSSASFDQWYNDVLGVNMSRPLTLNLVEQEDGSFVFDDKTDPLYEDRGGFFPVDGDLFGNSGNGPDHNFHFTFELHTEFTYDADADQIFKFIGDDDVWVYIDGKLAIDLGGVHASTEQFVDIGRFGLEDGESYTLDFFFAERHRTQSNFRIETNLDLVSTVKTPSMTAAFD